MDGIWITDAASFDGYDKSTTREGWCLCFVSPAGFETQPQSAWLHTMILLNVGLLVHP